MRKSVRHYLDLLTVLTQKEMKVRYKKNILGYMWSVAHPLSLAVVFYLAFKIVLRINIENYTVFLIAGLFPWQWFSNSVSAAPLVLLANGSLIKKISFPRHLIPFVQVMQDMIHFVLSIPVIMLALAVYHLDFYWSWIYQIPLLLVVQLMINYGISLFLSSINLFFRDLERLTTILLLLLFYCTPVFYAENMIPQKYSWLLWINPLSPVIVSWRNVFMSGELQAQPVLLGLAYGACFLAVGYAVFRKLSWKFAEVL